MDCGAGGECFFGCLSKALDDYLGTVTSTADLRAVAASEIGSEWRDAVQILKGEEQWNAETCALLDACHSEEDLRKLVKEPGMIWGNELLIRYITTALARSGIFIEVMVYYTSDFSGHHHIRDDRLNSDRNEDNTHVVQLYLDETPDTAPHYFLLGLAVDNSTLASLTPRQIREITQERRRNSKRKAAEI